MGDTVGCQLAVSLKTFNSHLHFLAVDNNGLTDEFAEALADSLQSEDVRLTYVELSHNRITDKGAITLSRALASVDTPVKRIWLGNNQVSHGVCHGPLADDYFDINTSTPLHVFDYIPAPAKSGN